VDIAVGGGEAPACRAELGVASGDDVMAASINNTTSPESEDITSDEVWWYIGSRNFGTFTILFVSI
jgi:hypothetical protein